MASSVARSLASLLARARQAVELGRTGKLRALVIVGIMRSRSSPSSSSSERDQYGLLFLLPLCVGGRRTSGRARSRWSAADASLPRPASDAGRPLAMQQHNIRIMRLVSTGKKLICIGSSPTDCALNEAILSHCPTQQHGVLPAKLGSAR